MPVKFAFFKIILLNALILLKYYGILDTLCSVMNIFYILNKLIHEKTRGGAVVETHLFFRSVFN